MLSKDTKLNVVISLVVGIWVFFTIVIFVRNMDSVAEKTDNDARYSYCNFRVANNSAYKAALEHPIQDLVYTTHTYNAIILENALVRVVFTTLGGRMMEMHNKHTATSSLYHCPAVFYRGVEQGSFCLKKGVAVYGGNFLTFPAPEHGRYFDQEFEMKTWREKSRACVEFTKVDSFQPTVEQMDAFSDFPATNGLFVVRHTLDDGHDVIRTNITASYPMNVVKTALWYATTLSNGTVSRDRTYTTYKAQMLLPANVTHTYEHDNWSWMKGKPQAFDVNEIRDVMRWEDMGIAYVRSAWIGLYDMNQLHVIACTKELNWKLWSFGLSSLTSLDNSIYQPYFEPWCSPLNTTFDSNNPGVSFSVKKGDTVSWNLFEFTLTHLSPNITLVQMQDMVEAKIRMLF